MMNSTLTIAGNKKTGFTLSKDWKEVKSFKTKEEAEDFFFFEYGVTYKDYIKSIK